MAADPHDARLIGQTSVNLVTRLRSFAGRHVPAVTRAEVREIRRSRAAARRGEAAARLRADDLAAENEQLRASLRAQEVRAGLAGRLARGESLEAAVVATVRDLIDAGEADEAAAVAHALADSPGGALAGDLAVAVVASARSVPELAYAAFRNVRPEAWRRHAVAEYLAAVYSCDPGRLPGVLRGLLDAPDASTTARTWHEVLRYAYVIREFDLVKHAFTLLVDRAAEESGSWPDLPEEIEWLRPWVEDAVPAAGPPAPAGHTPIALLGYGQPGRAKASQNIGDYVQTLAMLGHLVRRQDLRFHGDPELVSLARELQERVRPDRRLDGPGADVDLLVADRDATTYQTFPEGTWLVMHGWFLHPAFGLKYEFPLHQNLRPIIVSFHCSKRAMLTPELGHVR